MPELKGKFYVEIIRKGKVIDAFEVENVVTIEGRNQLLKVGVSQEASASNWYLGLIGANVTPSENDTASSALGTGGSYSEITQYDETTRRQYQCAFSNNAVSNSANPATFTINASVTAYGAFITNTATKNDNTGVLLCAGRFASAKTLDDDDVLNVVYTISSVTT